MSEPWLVMKFGGTSVAGRPQWDQIALLVAERRASGHRVLLVCSAMAGVTDALETYARAPGAAVPFIDAMLARHAQLAAELEIEAQDVLEQGRQQLMAATLELENSSGAAAQAHLLGLGEWFSSRLGERFLATQTQVTWVDVREALAAMPESDPDSRRAWLSASCEAFADEELESRWAKLGTVLITQGFALRAPDGRTALLGRGGSDTSAALLAGRLSARSLEIWTDVPGLYSADPRLEPGARLIESLSYAEALEMAAGGARVIHGRSIRAAAQAGVPIAIKSQVRPQLDGTLIGAINDTNGERIRAVCCQSNMAVVLLENLDTRQQVGFLAGVFRSIAARGVSVDLVATSETTTTLAISLEANHLDAGGLQALGEELSGHCRVEVFDDCCCVNLVGRGARTALARLGPAGSFFAERPLLMMSQSANDMSISLLVHARDAVDLQRLLHGALIA